MIIHDKWESYLNNIPDKSIDCILIDPPYNTTAINWDEEINFEDVWKQAKRLLKDSCACIVFAVQPFTSLLISSNINDFRYCWYWKKVRPTGHLNAKKRPLKLIEDLCVFSQNTTRYFPQGLQKVNRIIRNSASDLLNSEVSDVRSSVSGGINATEYFQEYGNYPTHILEFKNVRNNFHPTQKPTPLLEYLIKTYTKEGETVLDFFAGSGSTGEAAKNLNRKYILVERNGFYVQKMSERLQEQVECKTSGCTFCERTNRARAESCC